MRIFLNSTVMVLALTAPTLAKYGVTSMEIGKYNKVLCANDKGGETFTFGEKNTRSGDGYVPLANEPIGTEFVREWGCDWEEPWNDKMAQHRWLHCRGTVTYMSVQRWGQFLDVRTDFDNPWFAKDKVYVRFRKGQVVGPGDLTMRCVWLPGFWKTNYVRDGYSARWRAKADRIRERFELSFAPQIGNSKLMFGGVGMKPAIIGPVAPSPSTTLPPLSTRTNQPPGTNPESSR
jgi:hypothetical protein